MAEPPGSDLPTRLPSTVRHVLLVEDDSPVRGMISDLLEEAGYQVAEAIDGFQALKSLRERRPDLIILDLMLPGMSGWEFLERSRDRLERANIPVIILSAIKGRGDYPSTLGVAAWFNKPLDVLSFLQAVEQLVGPGRSLTDVAQTEKKARKPRILIVEDEPIIRDIIYQHLEGMGYRVELAGTIDEATARIARRTTDLVVLDLMLPGDAGELFLNRRRSDPTLTTVPVLVVSAAPQGRLLQAKELGADGFLSKPFDLDILGAIVRSFVGPGRSGS
jgi:DNA-binding response OmpR family regulator